MEFKLSILLMLSLYNISFANEFNPQEEMDLIVRSAREDEIFAKKEQGIELTMDEELDDPDYEFDAELYKPAPISLTTKVTNYCRLLAVVLYIQYLKLKDYLSSDKVKRNSELKQEKDENDNSVEIDNFLDITADEQ